jgi:ribosomal-protein-alanine N-acetyltransferase
MTHDHDILRPTPSLTTGLSMPRVADQIIVARAGFRDLRAVAKLQRRAFRPPLAYGLTTLIVLWFLPNVKFLLARRDERIVGCAIGDRQGGQSRVINLCVDPDFRRRGLGTRLLRALEETLPSGNIVLMVEERNTAAQTLYRQEGYLPVGTGRDYYGRGQDGIWMQKTRTGQSSPKIRV